MPDDFQEYWSKLRAQRSEPEATPPADPVRSEPTTTSNVPTFIVTSGGSGPIQLSEIERQIVNLSIPPALPTSDFSVSVGFSNNVPIQVVLENNSILLDFEANLRVGPLDGHYVIHHRGRRWLTLPLKGRGVCVWKVQNDDSLKRLEVNITIDLPDLARFGMDTWYQKWWRKVVSFFEAIIP